MINYQQILLLRPIRTENGKKWAWSLMMSLRSKLEFKKTKPPPKMFEIPERLCLKSNFAFNIPCQRDYIVAQTTSYAPDMSRPRKGSTLFATNQSSLCIARYHNK